MSGVMGQKKAKNHHVSFGKELVSRERLFLFSAIHSGGRRDGNRGWFTSALASTSARRTPPDGRTPAASYSAVYDGSSSKRGPPRVLF